MSDFVPLHESNLVPQHIARTMRVIPLPGGRKVMVGRMVPEMDGIAVRFETPEPGSDRTVVLTFGLNLDAAKALLTLIRHELP